MEAAVCTRLQGEINEMKWCYTPQDGRFHSHCSKNLKSPLIYQNLKYTTKFNVSCYSQISYIQALYMEYFNVSETLKIPKY